MTPGEIYDTILTEAPPERCPNCGLRYGDYDHGHEPCPEPVDYEVSGCAVCGDEAPHDTCDPGPYPEPGYPGWVF